MTSASQGPETIGKYRILGDLGRGAMGRVLLGEDPHLGRRVAIKILLPAADEESRERFLHEARIVGGFFHPNIVVLLEFGLHEDQPFLVMEHLDGESLETWLAGEHDLAEHLRIFRGLCLALDHAHERGVLHRDIKPSNVQVLPDGEAKLMDFGIARGAAGGLTATGMVLGTPEYIAPEILKDASYSRRADYYSLALLCYRALSGVQPFSGKTVESCLTKVLVEEPEPLDRLRPELPRELCREIMRLLVKKPEDRPDSLADLRASLEAVHEGKTVVLATRGAQATRVLPSLQATPRRKRWPWILGGLAAAVVAAWIATTPWLTPPPGPAEVAQRRPAVGEPAPPIDTSQSPPSELDEEATSADTTRESPAGTSPPPASESEPAAADEEVDGDDTPAASGPLPDSGGEKRARTPLPESLPGDTEPPQERTSGSEEDAAIEPSLPEIGPETGKENREPKLLPKEAESKPGTVAASPSTPPVAGGGAVPEEAEKPIAPRIDRVVPTVLHRGVPSELTVEGRFELLIEDVSLRRGRTPVKGIKFLGGQRLDEGRFRITVRIDDSVTLGSYSLVVVDEEENVSNVIRVEVTL